jgi:hypothetical protein
VNVLVRRMRRHARTKLGQVELHSAALMRCTVHDGALAIFSVDFDGQVFEFEGCGRQGLFVLRHGGGSPQRRQQQVQIATCETHRQVSSKELSHIRTQRAGKYPDQFCLAREAI